MGRVSALSAFGLVLALASCASIAGISDGDDTTTSDAGPSETPDATVVASEAGPDGTAAVDSSTADAAMPPTAGVRVICNGKVVQKYAGACTTKRWEYDFAPCGTIVTLVLENVGVYPIAWIARSFWPGTNYIPGQPTDGSSNEITGVIDAGGKADISKAYNTGIFALIGSVRPFDLASLMPRRDEGVIAYPSAMLKAYPTKNELYVAELTETPFQGIRCTGNGIVFTKK